MRSCSVYLPKPMKGVLCPKEKEIEIEQDCYKLV